MTTTKSLCPGYKQVDSFGPDEQYEGDEEVSYVTLDLGAGVEPTLVASSSTYRLIVRCCPSVHLVVTYGLNSQGLDTPTPFLQLSGTIWKGQHDSLIGSEIIFTEDKGVLDIHSSSDRRISCSRAYTYSG
jgi:general transcription factor 3C polypeptide 6